MHGGWTVIDQVSIIIQITVSVCLCVCVCVCVTEVMHFRVIASAFNEY